MSILSRYLYRNYLPTFGLCSGVFIFVLLMNHFLKLFNMALMKGISLTWILYCFSRLMPYFMSLALPMAFLVALLLTLGHLSETGEVMALRSSGFSFREILAPFALLAIGLSLALLYINHKASPEGFHSFKNSYSKAAASVSQVSWEPRAFTRLGDWELYAETVDKKTGKLTGIRLIKRHEPYIWLRVSAPEGEAAVSPGRGVNLILRRGALLWPSKDPGSPTTSTFGVYRLFLPFLDSSAADREAEMPELSTPRLKAKLRDGTLTGQHQREYSTEATLRSAGALAPFVLFWVACPLGLRMEKRSRVAGFAWSLALVFFYYGLLVVGIGLGRRSLAVSSWGPWIPNAACLLAAAPLWWRLLRR